MVALTLGDVVVYGGLAIAALAVLVVFVVGLVLFAGARALAHGDEGDA